MTANLASGALKSIWKYGFQWLLLLLSAAAGAESSSIRVVTDNNYPPYVVLGANGAPEGYIVDLWRLWERKTGIKVEFNAMQWSEAQRAMHDQQADVIDMIFRTPVREQLYDFSEPYATLPVSIYVDSSIHGVKGIESVRGFTIGVQRGDACVDTLVNQGVTSFLAFKNYDDMLSAAKEGQIKMFCMDDDPASYYLYLHRAQLRFARAFKLYEGQFHWAVNRGNKETYSLIQRGMALITAAERKELRDKWFSEPFEFRPYLRIILIVVLAAFGVTIVAGLWIMLLRRAVRARTAEILQKHEQLQIAARDLRKEEALLRAIIDSSPDAMSLKSPDGIYLDCNAQMLSALNRSKAEVIGQSDEAIFEDRSLVHAIRDNDREVLRNGQPLQYETIIATEDGSNRNLEVVKVLVHDAQGAPAGILTVARDVTERRQVESELRISAVAFEAHDGMMIIDANGVIERVNSSFARITGYPPEEVVGRIPSFLQPGLQQPQFYQEMWSTLSSDGYWQGEVVDRHKEGRYYSLRLSISKVTDAEGQTLRYVGNLQDITAEKAAQELAEHRRLFDALTDLPNRYLIERHITNALNQTSANQNSCAVMMIDLDFFHKVNDSLGHGIGDRLLIEMAQRLGHEARDSDMVGRFGGDNFVLVAEKLGENSERIAEAALGLAETIRRALEVPFLVEGHRIICTASIGVAFHNDGQVGNSEALLRQAEIAMYEAKTNGRNAVRFFESVMQTEIDRRRQIENELREAIDQNQLVLFYQLQVNERCQPIGAEALVRWFHPQRGIISPGEFIPLAEETGLIEPIGRWALATACRQIAEWAHNPATCELVVAVNISPRQLKSANIVGEVISIVRKAGVPAQKLKLEITESMAIDNLNDSMAKLEALKSAGFQISLDDFGTGNSSLNVLTKLPLTQLKIDKSFVDNLPNNHRDAMVAQTIINMGQGLDLHVIAEGVESEAQFNYLLDIGCPAFQGYYFGKPVSADLFEAHLRELETAEIQA
nr:EAL domain-containing protein [uncultured Undibacterium sp.]